MSSVMETQSNDILLRLLGEREVKIAALQKENASLRSRLDALNRDPGVDEHGPDGTVSYPSTDQSLGTPIAKELIVQSPGTSDYETLISKYNDLAKLYRDLSGKHARCGAKVERAMKKYNEAKENAKQWRAYSDRKAAEHAARRPVSTGVQTTDDTDIDPDGTPRPVRSNFSATNDEIPSVIIPTVYPGEILEMPAARNIQGHEGAIQVRSSSHPPRVSSSQTTEAESTSTDIPSSPPKRDTSSGSEPVLVSTRSLKRKRGDSTAAMPPPTRIKEEPKSPTVPIDLNSEDYSSPPRERHPLARRETSDLDALSPNLRSPRKQRHDDLRPRAVSEEVIRPPSLMKQASSLSDHDLPFQHDQELDVKLEPGMQAAAKVGRLGPATFARDPASAAVTERSKAHALRPLSVNLPAKGRLRDAVPAMSGKRKRDDGRKNVAALSEDGEDMSSQAATHTHTPSIQGATPKTHVSRRLDAMLDEPSPDRLPLAKSHTPVSAAAPRKKPLTPISAPAYQHKRPSPKDFIPRAAERSTRPLASTARPQAQAKHASPSKDNVARSKKPPGIEDSPPPVRPEDEPLRLRPLSALSLEDFRINKKFTGADFAYSETFRGREQRRCLPGCTRPEFCGDTFRKAVELGGTAGSTKSDAEVLEAYLGPNWEQLMGAYAPDKRKDLLEQARVAPFAKQYGKHRQAHERRSTPPGFWRTDMPTTQEEEEDRAKAYEMERQKVEERWREAMREDGRWRFRDE